MHSYTIDTSLRRKAVVILAFLSIGLSLGLNNIISSLNIPFTAHISAFLLFTAFYLSWSRLFWNHIPKMPIPDLEGEWEGSVKSSYADDEEYDVDVEITQNLDKIGIKLKTDTSVSHSETGAIQINTNQDDFLSYTYYNEPKTNAEDSMSPHRGFTRVTIKYENGKPVELEGQYFTDRNRKNTGKITLVKKD